MAGDCVGSTIHVPIFPAPKLPPAGMDAVPVEAGITFVAAVTDEVTVKVLYAGDRAVIVKTFWFADAHMPTNPSLIQ